MEIAPPPAVASVELHSARSAMAPPSRFGDKAFEWLTLAMALAVVVLVVMAWSDRTTREPKELENILRLPVVVAIPDLAMMEAADG